jgi:hypothetical protein
LKSVGCGWVLGAGVLMVATARTPSQKVHKRHFM